MSIYDSSTVKNVLYEQNRDYEGRLTWQNAYNDVALSAGKASTVLEKDYDTAVLDAYKSYLDNNKSIASSGLATGRAGAYQYNKEALGSAYDSYLTQLQEGQSKLASTYAENVAAIDQLLEQQAQNTIDYADSFYGYLEKLVEQYNTDQYNYNNMYTYNAETGQYMDADGNVVDAFDGLFTNPDWAKYLQTDSNGNLITDENGNVSLRSYNDLYNSFYTTQDGTIVANDVGQNFFDQLLNGRVGDYSFEQYLSEENPELYEWAKTYNTYNWSGGAYGNNADSFKQLVGLDPNDYEYNFTDYGGGLNRDQIVNAFTQNDQILQDIAGLDLTIDENRSTALESLNTAINSLYDTAETLGLDVDRTELEQTYNSLYTAISNNSLDAIDDATLAEWYRAQLKAEYGEDQLITFTDADGNTYRNTSVDNIPDDALAHVARNNNMLKRQYLSSELNALQQKYLDVQRDYVNELIGQRNESMSNSGLNSPYSDYVNSLNDHRTAYYKTLPNKTTIGSVSSNVSLDSYWYRDHVGSTITDNNGKKWKVVGYITNSGNNLGLANNGDAGLHEYIGSDDKNITDGQITKGAKENTYYMALAGFGSWALLEPVD